MPAPLLLPMIAAGTSLLNTGSQIATNASNRNFAREQANQQRQWALEDWRMNNAYNDPSNQMARFKAAGLNPNLIYGQTNTAAPVRSTETAKSPNQAPQLDAAGPLQAISQMYDLMKTQAQTNNLEAQRKLIEANTRLSLSNVANRNFDLSFKNQALDFNLEGLQMKNRLLTKQAYQADANRQYTEDQNKRAALNSQQSVAMNASRLLTMRMEREKTAIGKMLLQQQIQNLKTDNRVKQAELLYRQGLRAQGLDTNSPGALKLMSKAMDFLFSSDDQWSDYE